MFDIVSEESITSLIAMTQKPGEICVKANCDIKPKEIHNKVVFHSGLKRLCFDESTKSAHRIEPWLRGFLSARNLKGLQELTLYVVRLSSVMRNMGISQPWASQLRQLKFAGTEFSFDMCLSLAKTLPLFENLVNLSFSYSYFEGFLGRIMEQSCGCTGVVYWRLYTLVSQGTPASSQFKYSHQKPRGKQISKLLCTLPRTD